MEIITAKVKRLLNCFLCFPMKTENACYEGRLTSSQLMASR